MSDPDAESPAQPAASELAEFRARLRAFTPRVVVTPALVTANVLMFVAMVVRGVSPLSPAGDSLLAWGANYGPLSAGSEWWRLATAMFVHVGVIHLLMNMWVLWDAGYLVERLLGPAAFAIAYLMAGLAGSCASVLWHPNRLSAGASGAIFGIVGVLGAFLLKQRGSLPRGALTSLARSMVFFVGYNVVYGLTQSNIDMAAHLGGLLGGFAVGLPLVHELTPAARAHAWRRGALVLAAGLVVGGALWSRAPRFLDWRAQASLVRREVPGAAIRLPVGKAREAGLDYAEGAIKVNDADSSEATFEWHTAEMMTKEELRKVLVAPILAATSVVVAQETEVVVGGAKGVHYLLRKPNSDLSVMAGSIWPCGKRTFSLIVSGRGAARLEQQIRDSFECRPDPARDGRRRAIGVQLDSGPEFGSIDSQNTIIDASLDGQVIFVTRFPARSDSEEIWQNFVPKFLANLVGNAFHLDAPSFGPMTVEQGQFDRRMVWRGKARKDDRPFRLLAVTIDCGLERYVGVYYGSDAFPETRGLAPLLAARCSDAPTRPPLITDMARAACARGDQRGCSFE